MSIPEALDFEEQYRKVRGAGAKEAKAWRTLRLHYALCEPFIVAKYSWKWKGKRKGQGSPFGVQVSSL